jgi:hypothetical protein
MGELYRFEKICRVERVVRPYFETLALKGLPYTTAHDNPWRFWQNAYPWGNSYE